MRTKTLHLLFDGMCTGLHCLETFCCSQSGDAPNPNTRTGHSKYFKIIKGGVLTCISGSGCCCEENISRPWWFFLNRAAFNSVLCNSVQHLHSDHYLPLQDHLTCRHPCFPPSIPLVSFLNVYISCNRLLRGAPEFILQPVVMAHFLAKTWQLLVVDS